MLYLIKNIYIIHKYTIWTGILWILAGLFIFKSVVSAAIIPPISLYFQRFFVDEKDRVERLYLSLPINRSSIVISKYFEILIFSVFSVIVTIIITWLLKLLVPSSILFIKDIFTFKEFFAISFSLILLVSLFTPFLLYLGAVKGILFGTISIVIFFMTLLTTSYFVVIQKGIPIDHSIQGIDRIASFLNQIIASIKEIIGKETILAFLSGVGLVLLLISIFVSLKIYKKKEIYK